MQVWLWQPPNPNQFMSICSINTIGNFAASLALTTANFSPPLTPRRRLCNRSLCLKHDRTTQASGSLDGFSGIPPDVPFDIDNLWSNFGLYLFSLHVPMSFGGLSAVARVMNLTVLDPQIEALSLLSIQTLELIFVLSLLNYTAKPESDVFSFLKSGKLSAQRNWLLASFVGFLLLIVLIFLISVIEDVLLGPKGANNPILKDIIQSSNISRTACTLAYCIITPLLEETVFRGYLLSALASTTKWQYAVLISSAVFSAAHFSADNAFQLFVIGSVLGSSYCWTGNLRCSILIHSMYNALSLAITFLS
uniref:CAAX prenyl protease 2/Lysostaphin resistance protein A-like domain-containing protein n=1 Tax=Kalanchoe fedtschenkoi TaxID=63787 RepID=A0A7N0UL77_KALFE